MADKRKQDEERILVPNPHDLNQNSANKYRNWWTDEMNGSVGIFSGFILERTQTIPQSRKRKDGDEKQERSEIL